MVVAQTGQPDAKQISFSDLIGRVFVRDTTAKQVKSVISKLSKADIQQDQLAVLVLKAISSSEDNNIKKLVAETVLEQLQVGPVTTIATSYLFKNLGTQDFASIYQRHPDKCRPFIQSQKDAIELSLDIALGAERVALVASYQVLNALLPANKPGFEAINITDKVKALAEYLSGSEGLKAEKQEVACFALAAVALHAKDNEWASFNKQVKAWVAEATNLDSLKLLIQEAKLLLQSKLEQGQNSKNTSKYQEALNRLGKLEAKVCADLIHKDELVPPKLKPIEQLEGMLNADWQAVIDNKGKISKLTNELGDSANQLFSAAIVRFSTLDQARVVLTTLFEIFRERASAARLDIIINHASSDGPLRAFAVSELVEFCVGSGGLKIRTLELREAARQAYFEIAEFALLFNRQDKNRLANLFNQRDPENGGLFKDREQITRFVETYLLPHPDRMAAFALLASFRWNRLLSEVPDTEKTIKVESCFYQLLVRQETYDYSWLNCKPDTYFGIVLEVFRLYNPDYARAKAIAKVFVPALNGDDKKVDLLLNYIPLINRSQQRLALIECLAEAKLWDKALPLTFYLIFQSKYLEQVAEVDYPLGDPAYCEQNQGVSGLTIAHKILRAAGVTEIRAALAPFRKSFDLGDPSNMAIWQQVFAEIEQMIKPK